MDVRHVAVAGTGMMGPGIAATFALAGRQATIVSRTPEGASKGVATAKSLIGVLAKNGLADPAQAKDAAARLSSSTDPETAVRAVQLFVESIPEISPPSRPSSRGWTRLRPIRFCAPTPRASASPLSPRNRAGPSGSSPPTSGIHPT